MKINFLYRKRFWLLLIGGTLLAILGSQLPITDWFFAFKKWLFPLGPMAVPVFVFIYLVATVLGLPNILLILVAGALFGFFKGILAASIADTLGAIACFLIGRTIARERIKKWISQHPRFSQLDAALGRKGWKILLLTRLSPMVPSNLLNYGFSCTKVNFWQYVFFSWLGMLPVISLYVYIGAMGINFFTDDISVGKIGLQLVGLLLAISAAFYTTKTVQKALTPECPKADIEPRKSQPEIQKSK